MGIPVKHSLISQWAMARKSCFSAWYTVAYNEDNHSTNGFDRSGTGSLGALRPLAGLLNPGAVVATILPQPPRGHHLIRILVLIIVLVGLLALPVYTQQAGLTLESLSSRIDFCFQARTI